MNRLLTFNTAVILVVIMAGISWINGQNSTNGFVQTGPGGQGYTVTTLNPRSVGLLLVYLVLAAIVPFIMVPIGLIVVLWQVLHSLGLSTWITAVSTGPAAKLNSDNG